METKQICESYLKTAPEGAEVTEIERVNGKIDYVVTYEGRVIYDPMPSHGFIKSKPSAVEVVPEAPKPSVEAEEKKTVVPAKPKTAPKPKTAAKK